MQRSRLVYAIGALFVLTALQHGFPNKVSGRDAGSTGGDWTVSGFPVIMYAPETGLGLGGGLHITHRAGDLPETSRPLSLPFVLIYTTKGQSIVAAIPEIYFGDGAWALRGPLQYANFPSTMYGVGNDTPDEAEEDFTTETGEAEVTLVRRLYSGLKGGLSCYVVKTIILETEPGRVYEEWREMGRAGGARFGIGPVVEWDTRDDIFYPSAGGWYQFTARFYREGLGSDYEYDYYAVNLRRYLSVTENHIVAVQVLAETRSGQVPIEALASLGNYMRGVFGYRYQDLSMAVARAEYRFPISRRISGAAFASVGDVSHGRQDFTADHLKHAGGVGLRFQISDAETMNVRFDIGLGEDGTQFYFQIGEAF
jgi:hypothetical protein